VLDAQADDASMTPNFFTSQTDTIRSSIRSAFNHKIILGDVAPQVLADGTPSIAMPVLAKLKLMGVYPDLFKEARVKDDFRKCLRAAYEQIPGHVPHNGQLLFAMRAAGTGFLASSSKWPEFDGGTLDLRPIQAFTESIRQSPKKPPTIAGERAIGTMLAYAATDILMVHGSFDGEYTALSPNDRRELASSFASAAGQLGPGTADAFARTMSVVLADRARRMFQELDFTLQDAIQAWSRQPALAANLKAASCDPETGTWSLKNLSECDPATTQVARKSPNGTWVVQGDNLAHGADHVVISKDGTNIFRDPAGRNIAVARANEPARLMPGREPQMSPSENMLETMGLLRAGWAR
jgi:hypothetical protein